MFDLSNWTFDLASPQDLAPYYDPYINNDPGFMYTPGTGMVPTQFSMPPAGGGFNVGNAPLMPGAMPSFSPSSAPAPGGPAPDLMSAATTSSSANAPATLGGVQGGGDRGSGPSKTTPGISASSGSAVSGRNYQPGSQANIGVGPDASLGNKPSMQSYNNPYQAVSTGKPWYNPFASDTSSYAPGVKPLDAGMSGQQSGGFGGFMKDLGRAATSSGVQALIGGGLSALGSALAPKPQMPKPMSTGSGLPMPAPQKQKQEPMAPLPGANWSPLLMQNPMTGGNPNIGLEVEKKMRRGKNTGGMSMY